MEEYLSKKIKISNLIVTIRKEKKYNSIMITKELYSHIFKGLPQCLIDVHKFENVQKEEKTQLLIKTRNNGTDSLYDNSKEKQYICGVVEKGMTGKQKIIIDSKKNKLVREVKRSEAVLSPVFFMLVFSWKLNSLYLMTEDDASENIYSDIISAIKSSIMTFYSAYKVTMKSEIVMHDDVIDYIKNGTFSQIKIKRKKIPADIADRLYNVKVEKDDECTIEIKISAKNKNFTGKLVEKIKKIGSDGFPSISTMEELTPFGLDEESEIVIESTLNGNKRPISISKLKTPNISHIIQVLKAEDGYADFNSIRKESLKLFSDIVEYL